MNEGLMKQFEPMFTEDVAPMDTNVPGLETQNLKSQSEFSGYNNTEPPMQGRRTDRHD